MSIKSKWTIGCLLYLWLFTTSAPGQDLPKDRPQSPPQISFQVANGYLKTTLGGLSITKKTLPFFVSPADHASRWAAINHYFEHRFGIRSARSYHFWPKAIVLHSTESESEAGVFNTFAHDTSNYLGGVWTTFVVDADGTIYQYSPLDKLSKGQAGVNDLAVGIEIVGTASTYSGAQRVKQGSIARRYEAGKPQQLQSVIDLSQTLQQLLDIPSTRVFSHQEVAQIKMHAGQNPDYDWLKQNIKDKVYLGEAPLLNGAGVPTRTYDYLQPYGRTDPGSDVMDFVRDHLR